MWDHPSITRVSGYRQGYGGTGPILTLPGSLTLGHGEKVRTLDCVGTVLL